MIKKTHPDEIALYLRDASNFSDGSAEMVIIPDSVEELSFFLKMNRQKIIVAGAGTGVTAGRIPYSGIIISMERMNLIGCLKEGTIRVEAGVRLADLNDILLGTGWFYPPNPTETLSFLGGNVATNASGPRSYKYGSTRRYILEIGLTLPNGSYVNIKRGQTVDAPLICSNGMAIEFPTIKYISPTTKNASGYYIQPGMDWIDLLIGSDGTLGVVTDILLKLLPCPERFFSAILFFSEEELCWHAVESIKNSQDPYIDPCALEYFDSHCISRLRNKYSNIPKSAKSALFLEQDIMNENQFDPSFEAWYEFLKKKKLLSDDSWFAESEKDIKKFYDFRHSIALILNEENSRLGRVKIGTDFAVPNEKFNDMMKFYQNTLTEGGLDYAVFGHIGDNHLHINLLPDEDQSDQAIEIYQILVNQILLWKGVVSAEHGIGKLKKKWFHRMVGKEALEEMRSIKRAFDPSQILGTGNLF